jgi:hypothetical protein
VFAVKFRPAVALAVHTEVSVTPSADVVVRILSLLLSYRFPKDFV